MGYSVSALPCAACLQELSLDCSLWECCRRSKISKTFVVQNFLPLLSFNTKGAWWGSIVSIAVVTFIVVGAQINIFKGQLLYETLPFKIEQCDATAIANGIT